MPPEIESHRAGKKRGILKGDFAKGNIRRGAVEVDRFGKVRLRQFNLRKADGLVGDAQCSFEDSKTAMSNP